MEERDRILEAYEKTVLERLEDVNAFNAVKSLWNDVVKLVKSEIQDRKTTKRLKQIEKMLGEIVDDMEKQRK